MKTKKLIIDKILFLVLIIFALAILTACGNEKKEETESEITLASVFTDNVVLQRGEPVNIFGYGVNGTVVTVEFNGQTKSGTVSDGRFDIKLDAMTAKTVGSDLVVSCYGDQHTIKNVVVGDVWYCSGQSNMKMLISELETEFAQKYETFTSWSNIRVASLAPNKFKKPKVNSTPITWVKPSSIADLSNYSAFATAYALHLAENLNNVPIAVLECSVPGSSITEWLPIEETSNPIRTDVMHSYLYNGAVYSLKGLTCKGILWYQGEADRSNGERYEQLFASYLKVYRGLFNNTNLPVVTIQLPAYTGANFTDFRINQWNIMKNNSNVYTVCTIDLGNAIDLHPQDKKLFGTRAANTALNTVYGKADVPGISACGLAANVVDDKIIIDMDYLVGTMFLSDSSCIKNLQICKENNDYVEVQGVVSQDGKHIEIAEFPTGFTADDCTAVKYLLDSDKLAPEVNLFTNNNLPVAPFALAIG